MSSNSRTPARNCTAAAAFNSGVFAVMRAMNARWRVTRARVWLNNSADRPLKKRKFDLTTCIRELLHHGIVELGKGQTDPKHLFLKRGKGVYVVQFFEGDYFRRPLAERTTTQLRAIASDPLYQPLRCKHSKIYGEENFRRSIQLTISMR